MMSSTLWSMTTLAGLWGFIACTIVLMVKGFPARGVFDRAGALPWGVGAAASFVVWIVGMSHA